MRCLVVVGMLLGSFSGALSEEPAHGQEIKLVNYRFDPLVQTPSLDPGLTRISSDEEELATFIVQFTGPITPADRQWVEKFAQVLGYLPDYAYLVSSSHSAMAHIGSDSSVRWIGYWEPAYKICPSIGTMTFTHPDRVLDPLLTLRLTTRGSTALTREKILRAGAVIVDVVDRLEKDRFTVKASRETLPLLAHIDEVLWIEELPEYYTLNNTTSWVIQTNGFDNRKIWDKGVRGEGEMAVVMDTGLDYNSCWFRDPGKTPGANHRKVKYYGWYGGAEYDGCEVGHGSHVAGTVCGDQSYINPGNQLNNGMAPDSDVGMQDIGMDDAVSCALGLVFPPNDLTVALQHAQNQGARVHTNSWGSVINTYGAIAVDVDDFMFRRPNMLIVFANGNSGPSLGSVGSPATAKNCISVGATRQAPSQNTVTTYSSRGPTQDGRLKPTLCAPGGGDSAALINSVDNDPGNPPGNTCASMGTNGTSMAAPAVAGAALLVRDYFEQGYYPSGEPNPADSHNASGALVKAMLINAGADMQAADIPNNNEGWGRIRIDNSFFFKGDTRDLRIEDETTGLNTGNSKTYQYDVLDGSALEITLVWSDAPATQGADPALVNDLNLRVTTPDGTTYWGNVFSGGQSSTNGPRDSLNVEETVLLKSPVPGTYTIRVGALNVPNGPQPFALVATGFFDNWPPRLCPNDASTVVYGSGHPGTNGIPNISATDPILGTTMQVTVDNSLGATTAGSVIMGFASASIPGFGGTLLVIPSAILPVVIPGGGATLPGNIPENVALCDLSLFVQILEIDPGASNGVSMTPGLEVIFGS